jgi:WD40 repeat protein
MNDNEYHLGGSLPIDAPTYVKRQADENLYQALKQSQYCYVLNCRQMGKSSLGIRTMQRLQNNGIASAFVDLTEFGSENDTTKEQWYWSLIDSLLSSFQLWEQFDLETWWQQNDRIPLAKRFSKFIKEILLEKIKQPIVIFLDEIDSILGLEFCLDDFFALIRYFYNQRAIAPEFKRLTFALLGVATPSDLIQDRTKTPFNIGTGIELQGFQLLEVQPLVRGLQNKVYDPQAAMNEVLHWTGGQPFLTQRLCKLVAQSTRVSSTESEEQLVERITQEKILKNWEIQDNLEHFKTIRDRILRNEKQTAQLLGLYQQILQHEQVLADNSLEEMTLRLSGLIVEQQGKLFVYNRLYKSIFDWNWTNNILAKLRPYNESLNAWLASDCQDKSRLLHGQALEDALKWSEGKDLSAHDYKFLSASQEAKRVRQIFVTTIIAFSSVAIATIIGLFVQSNIARQDLIKALVAESKSSLLANDRLGALKLSLKASRQLEKVIALKPEIRNETVAVLQQAVDVAQEQNRLEGHNNWIWDVSFSPNSLLVATASDDNTVKLWNRNGQLLKILEGHEKRVKWVRFSPNGQIVASASFDKTVKLWSAKDGKLLQTLEGHDREVETVSFSPDGNILASGSADGTIRLWHTKDGTAIGLLKSSNDRKDKIFSGVFTVSFSPDGKTLASGSADGKIRLWSTEDGTLLKTLEGHTETVRSVSFSPNGETIASGSFDETVKLWNRDGVLLATLKGHHSSVTRVSFSPDGKILASASWDRTVKLWNLDRNFTLILERHNAPIRSISWSPNGEILASASDDGKARLWKRNGQLLNELKGHQGPVRKVRFSSDGQTIATTSDDETIKLWDISQLLNNRNYLPKTIEVENRVFGVSFSPDGQTIASASDDNMVKLWNREGNLLKILGKHDDFAVDVSFSPDGQIVASASDDKTVKLWNREGKLLYTFWHCNEVNSVEFSRDGKTLVSASDDRSVILWHLNDRSNKTDRPQNCIDRLYKTPFKSSDRVMSATFSPNGKIIASGSIDGTIELWDLNGTPLQTLTGHDNFVWDVSFNPKYPTLLASSSSDKTIRLWRINNKPTKPSQLKDLLKSACDKLDDYLKNNPNVSSEDRHLCDRI